MTCQLNLVMTGNNTKDNIRLTIAGENNTGDTIILTHDSPTHEVHFTDIQHGKPVSIVASAQADGEYMGGHTVVEVKREPDNVGGTDSPRELTYDIERIAVEAARQYIANKENGNDPADTIFRKDGIKVEISKDSETE